MFSGGMETLQKLPFQKFKRQTKIFVLIIMTITGTMLCLYYQSLIINYGVNSRILQLLKLVNRDANLTNKHEVIITKYTTDSFKVQPDKNSPRLNTLPNLKLLQWPVWPVSKRPAGYVPNKSISDPPGPMEPVMSIGQRQLLYRLLKIISDTMFNHSMGDRFMISYGTLLGSMRHHDFIPWDDDIDVLMDIEVRSKMRDALGRLAPDYVLYKSKICDRFAAKSILPSQYDSDVQLSRPVKDLAWPFVDITFFKVTRERHIKDISNNNIWPMSSIFPLYFRPFGRYWFPAPRDFRQVHNGAGTMCVKQTFSHALQKIFRYNDPKTACNTLTKRYAFVRRQLCPGFNRNEVNGDGMVMAQEELSIMVEGQWKVYHSICLPVMYDSIEYNQYLG